MGKRNEQISSYMGFKSELSASHSKGVIEEMKRNRKLIKMQQKRIGKKPEQSKEAQPHEILLDVPEFTIQPNGKIDFTNNH